MTQDEQIRKQLEELNELAKQITKVVDKMDKDAEEHEAFERGREIIHGKD